MGGVGGTSVIIHLCTIGIGVGLGWFSSHPDHTLIMLTNLRIYRYNGDHHRFWGFLTRRHSLMDLGRAKREQAKHEREKERRHRLRRLRDEGLAIRLGAEYMTKDPTRRSRRRRHHHSSRAREVVVSS